MTPLTRIRTTLSSVLLPGDPLRSLMVYVSAIEDAIAERDEREYERNRNGLMGYLYRLVEEEGVDYGDRTDLIDELDARWKEAAQCKSNT